MFADAAFFAILFDTSLESFIMNIVREGLRMICYVRKVNYYETDQMGIVVPVISVDCQYKIPLRYGDCVRIKVCLARFDGIKLKFAYEIADPGTGKIHAAGQSRHEFMGK